MKVFHSPVGLLYIMLIIYHYILTNYHILEQKISFVLVIFETQTKTNATIFMYSVILLKPDKIGLCITWQILINNFVEVCQRRSHFQ